VQFLRNQAFSKLKLEQRVHAPFRDDPWMWIQYDDYDEVAVTQKVDRFMIRGGIGFFVTF
jgi:hypothetical protein